MSSALLEISYSSPNELFIRSLPFIGEVSMLALFALKFFESSIIISDCIASMTELLLLLLYCYYEAFRSSSTYALSSAAYCRSLSC